MLIYGELAFKIILKSDLSESVANPEDSDSTNLEDSDSDYFDSRIFVNLIALSSLYTPILLVFGDEQSDISFDYYLLKIFDSPKRSLKLTSLSTFLTE